MKKTQGRRVIGKWLCMAGSLLLIFSVIILPLLLEDFIDRRFHIDVFALMELPGLILGLGMAGLGLIISPKAVIWKYTYDETFGRGMALLLGGALVLVSLFAGSMFLHMALVQGKG